MERFMSDDPLVGLRVLTLDDCKCGGGRESIIVGERQLQCMYCAAPHGRLGPRATSFITAIIEQFGRSSEPIKFNKALGHVESSDLFQPAGHGSLTTEWLASRRRPFGSVGGSAKRKENYGNR
jgi:hypothetical protein